MAEEFLSNTNETLILPASQAILTPPNPQREAVQILVIGSTAGITNIIHSLYSHHFAHISEWSPLMPAPVPGKMMRMLIRQIPVQ